MIRNKSIALAANQTSLIYNTHLADSLRSQGIAITCIFAPEHGFRGTSGAGEKIHSGVDLKTGIPIISLYGKHYKPRTADLKNVDIIVFDIQDVGVRFYTYISTLYYIMEACAEHHIPLIVLDRPNPNGFYIDGPVLDMKYRSFVGVLPIPVVYGMTVGELARMINGEHWLKNNDTCSLTVIPCTGYEHSSRYSLPVKPSPNLPNMQAVYLYPSLGLFEGTVINVGRGTPYPFQVFGHPDLEDCFFTYIPDSTYAAPDPLHKGHLCRGVDLRTNPIVQHDNSLFTLSYLMLAYNKYPEKKSFFNRFFYNLSGTSQLRLQIEQGMDEQAIRKTWEEPLKQFKENRKKYLLYGE